MGVKLIDLEKVIYDKNPGLLKWMPSFLLNYLKGIIHQEEINQVLLENQELKGEEFCRDVIRRFNINVEVSGTEHIAVPGGVIFVSNHPLGGMDAIAFVDKIMPIRNDFKFIVNDILLNLENVRDLFIGVNKHGKNAKESLKAVDDLFASNQSVVLFPAGLVSRKIKGKITDLEWKKTFVTRARKYNKPIIPVHIEGRLSNFFYKLSNLRTFLGIKSNIEMLYLADEMFLQKNQTIRIKFGAPIHVNEFSEMTDQQITENIKKRVYSL